MYRPILALTAALMALLLPSLAVARRGEPRQYEIPTPTATATSTATPCGAARQVPTAAPTATQTATSTPTPCASPCPSARQEPTAAPTPTATATSTPCPEVTPASGTPNGYLKNEVAPEVIGDVAEELHERNGAATYRVPVGPFDEEVQLAMELRATPAAASISKTIVVGKGKRSLAQGKRGTLKLKLTKRGRKARNRRGKLKVRATLVVRGVTTGTRATAKRRVTLRSG